jgi:hypothetical protein
VYLKHLFPVLFFLLLSACYRQGSINTSIIFKGQVNSGHLGQNSSGSSTLIVDGPQQNATVSCESYSGTATTAADGSYSLTIHAVRRFSGQNTDTYTLIADTGNGASEKITVSAVPGEIVPVRSFVLYKHVEE